MKFTRTVSCTDEFAGDTPEVMVVEIDAALAERIRELAVEVKRLDVHAIELFNYSARWYEADWDQDEAGEYFKAADSMYPVPGEECTDDMDCHILKVSDDDFWWEASLKGSAVKVISDSIPISELPE